MAVLFSLIIRSKFQATIRVRNFLQRSLLNFIFLKSALGLNWKKCLRSFDVLWQSVFTAFARSWNRQRALGELPCCQLHSPKEKREAQFVPLHRCTQVKTAAMGSWLDRPTNYSSPESYKWMDALMQIAMVLTLCSRIVLWTERQDT